MNEQELADIISRTAEDAFRQASLPYDAARVFRDIPGFDSVLAIEFILAMEAAVGTTLNEEDVDTMHTMGDLMRMLLARGV
jgi:acyl carrier protein